MRKILTILAIILTVNANAQNAYPLKKGDVAPVDGVLLIPSEANRLKNLDMENEYTKKENQLLDKVNNKLKLQIDIQQQRVDVYQKQNNDLADRVQDLSSDNFWKNTVWFLIGVGATIGVGYAASRSWQ